MARPSEQAADSRSKRRTQEERSASTRKRVIDATLYCLANKGYSSTTLSEIIKQAGVSRGALLHHFPSKIDLVAASMQSFYEKLAEEAVARMQEQGGERCSLRERIRIIAELSTPSKRRYVSSSWLQLGQIPNWPQRTSISWATAWAATSRIFDEVDDPRAMAAVVSCFLIGHTLMGALQAGTGEATHELFVDMVEEYVESVQEAIVTNVAGIDRNIMHKVSTITAYASPLVPIWMLHTPALSILPGLYATVSGIDLATLGAVLAVGRILDGITDPVIGVLSDRTRTADRSSQAVDHRRRPAVHDRRVVLVSAGAGYRGAVFPDGVDCRLSRLDHGRDPARRLAQRVVAATTMSARYISGCANHRHLPWPRIVLAGAVPAVLHDDRDHARGHNLPVVRRSSASSC